MAYATTTNRSVLWREKLSTLFSRSNWDGWNEILWFYFMYWTVQYEELYNRKKDLEWIINDIMNLVTWLLLSFMRAHVHSGVLLIVHYVMWMVWSLVTVNESIWENISTHNFSQQPFMAFFILHCVLTLYCAFVWLLFLL